MLNFDIEFNCEIPDFQERGKKLCHSISLVNFEIILLFVGGEMFVSLYSLHVWNILQVRIRMKTYKDAKT